MPDTRCMNCYNFKTMVLHKKNMAQSRFIYSTTVANQIEKEGEVRVFFCAKRKTKADVYIESPRVSKIEVVGCDSGEF